MKEITEKIFTSLKFRQSAKYDEEVEVLDFAALQSLTVELITRSHNRPMQQGGVSLETCLG
jgi:hypothetical protein